MDGPKEGLTRAAACTVEYENPLHWRSVLQVRSMKNRVLSCNLRCVVLRSHSDARTEEPVHTAIQTLECVSTIQIPCQIIIYWIWDRLTATWPFGGLEAFNESLRKFVCILKNVTLPEECTREFNSNGSILNLVLSSETCCRVRCALRGQIDLYLPKGTWDKASDGCTTVNEDAW